MANTDERGETSGPDAQDTKARLVDAGAQLFSERGFDGASVREICRAAETSSNMIHHYFGNKEGLYDAVIARMSEHVFEVPMRIIDRAPESREEFAQLLRLFMEETLQALIAERCLFTLMVRDHVTLDVFNDYIAAINTFLTRAQEAGVVREGIDSEMLTGLIMDRLGNQVMYSEWIAEASGADIVNDAAYRRRWLSAHVDLLLHGVLHQESHDAGRQK